MDFLTIHQLSREFDLPGRVVRYRLLNYLQAGSLHEGDDYRREDYKDDRHFVWKVNPLTFMRVSGLKPKSLPLELVSDVNELLTTVNDAVIKPTEFVNDPISSDTKVDNEAPTAEFRSDLEREMIEFLKEQIGVKDRQLKEQADQYKQVNEVNMKLMGATLQQSNKIEELLRLVGEQGREEPRSTDSVNQEASGVHNIVNESKAPVNEEDRGTNDIAA